MDYVVKMDGETVRQFSHVDKRVVEQWAKKHCRGKIEIHSLRGCRLPQASKPIRPNLDMPDLRYKPFVSLG